MTFRAAKQSTQPDVGWSWAVTVASVSVSRCRPWGKPVALRPGSDRLQAASQPFNQLLDGQMTRNMPYKAPNHVRKCPPRFRTLNWVVRAGRPLGDWGRCDDQLTVTEALDKSALFGGKHRY